MQEELKTLREKYEKRIVKIKDQLIEISGYLYPKEDDFEDLELYQELGGAKGWFHSQGIYIYREELKNFLETLYIQ